MLLQNVKNDQNGAKFLGTSLEVTFQLLISPQGEKLW